jgi:glycerophosphoryl diester phosphodiesterase
MSVVQEPSGSVRWPDGAAPLDPPTSTSPTGPLLAIAHRAGNNLTALRTALDAGVDLIEADIQLFRDALEVRHGSTLGRHLLWDEWQLIRRRSDLPVLREMLAAMPGDPRVMLDLKGTSHRVGAHVAAVLREVAPGVPVTVCTKYWPMLDAFGDDPHIRRVFSASSRTALSRLRARLRHEPAFGVSIRRQLLTPSIVAELRRAVDVVMVWPVDSAESLAHARRLGVTGVISKKLPLLRQVMATR